MPLQTTTGKFGAWKNGFLSINGVDLSSFARTVTLKRNGKIVPLTAMGDDDDVSGASTKSWTLEVEFYQSYYAAEVDATLDPLVGAAAFPLIIRPDSGTIGDLNPQWDGSLLLTDYQPLGGSHGEELMAPTSFTGTGTLVRTIA